MEQFSRMDEIGASDETGKVNRQDSLDSLKGERNNLTGTVMGKPTLKTIVVKTRLITPRASHGILRKS